MVNLVQITVKASDASSWDAIKARAAEAGAAAADAFNDAFKLRADAKSSATERLKETGGLGGSDKELFNKLRSYANTPGGIGLLGTGNDTSLQSMLRNQIRQMGESGGVGLLSSGAGNTSSEDIIRQVMAGNGPSNVSTEDIIKQVMEGSGPSNVSTKDLISQVMEGNSPGNVTTKDLIDQILQGTGPSNITTKDFISQIIEGKEPGNIDTKDIIHPTVDDSDIKALGEKDGENYGSSFASKLKSVLSGVLGGKSGGKGGMSDIGSLLTGSSGGGGGDESAIGGALNSGGIAGGALPGVAGVSGLAATVTGLAAALVAVLPAITAVAGGLASIGGGFAILLETDAKFAAAMKSTLGALESVFKAAALPLAQPLEQAATQIVGYFKQIEPDLKAVFADSASLIQPLVKGFEDLMSGAGPGFLAMIKAAGPVFNTVGQAFANLGKSLGTMFQDFASDGGASATVLKALLDIVNSLLPFIGKLGQLLVSALAPAFLAFSGALSKVLPALSPLLSILGDFAGAVLNDLASVLGALGSLLVALAPSFKTLATVAASLFNTLENTGVFAILGDALESLAAPIGNLVNALVKGIAPALPQIITLVSQLSAVFVTLVSDGLGVMINALAQVIKFISPLLPAIVDIVAAIKLWTIAQGLLDIALDANPIGLFVLAVAALIGVIVELATHWSTVWATIKSVAGTVGSYLDGLFHNTIIQDILDVWSLGLIPLAEHWSEVWNDIEKVTADVEITVLEILRDIVSGFLSFAGDVIDAAAKAFGWVPGVGGLLKTAASDFSSYRSGVISNLNNMISGAQSWRSALDNVPTKITTDVTYTGGGTISVSAALKDVIAHIEGMASGGMVSGGIPGRDSVLGMLMPGELVVPSGLVPLVAPLLAGKIPGFAAGGFLGTLGPWAYGETQAVQQTSLSQAASLMAVTVSKGISEALAAQQAAAAAAAASSGAGAAGPGGGAPAANAALAKKLYPPWSTGIMWTDWNNVAMRESGWNQFARNPGSGAYGIPQALPPSKMGAAANPPESNPTAQINWMVGYIKSVYGSPVGAWNSEVTRGWYDQGGWLPTGKSIAINNTGAPERILGPGEGVNVSLEIAASGDAEFDKFMINWIRNKVRIKGGGSVQTAFGRS